MTIKRNKNILSTEEIMTPEGTKSNIKRGTKL
jgi:hypothetical protein